MYAAACSFSNHQYAVHSLHFGKNRAGCHISRKRRFARGASFGAKSIRNGRILTVHDQQTILFRNFAGPTEKLKVGDIFKVTRLTGAACRNEGLERRNPCIRERCQILEIPRNKPSHRRIINPTLPFGCLEFDLQTWNIRRARDLIQRHFCK